MHDIHEANKILNLVLQKAKENNITKVKKIVLELGEIIEHGQIISADNLKFNLELLAEKNIAKQAEIVINKTEENFWKLVEISGA